MSVTFEPENQLYYKVPNEYFESDVEESPVLNPRYIQEPAYPCYNFSNMNAALVMQYSKRDHYVGKATPEELPEFIQELKLSIDKERASKVIHLAKICIANNWNLVWG